MGKRVKLIVALAITTLFISCSGPATDVMNDDIGTNSEASVGQYSIVSDGHVEEYIQELCSDEMKGRVVGTDENIKATEYIDEEFKNLGLTPFIGDNNLLKTDLRFNDTVETNNVAAVLKGSESSNAVFITAHLDHIYLNAIEKLPGVIDNASGISVLLETAHKLSDLTKENKLNMDVIFVAFNAEETGLNGSIDFVEKYKNTYDKLYNINIDCVGYKNSLNLAMGNNHQQSNSLYEAMRDMLDNESVQYNDSLYATKDGIQRGTSDHEVFRINGFPALVFGDDEILDVVHTKDDNLENIDYTDLVKLSEVITKFLINNDDKMFY